MVGDPLLSRILSFLAKELWKNLFSKDALSVKKKDTLCHPSLFAEDCPQVPWDMKVLILEGDAF